MLLEGKHIYIVEDNQMNRIVYQMTLQMQGAYLEFDRWGKDASHKLANVRHWDLIILDLMLAKGISGYDIFEDIRQMPHHENTPIIAISASEPSVAIPKVRELGFNGFISKPIDEELICDQVLRAINGEAIWHDGTLRV
jgi:CheY-like chemotaxis protein